jgi:LysR family cyn operon transcriptional activator
MKRKLGYKDIELRQLRTFCLAATQKNFTAAAAALGLSLSTVWEQVRALECKLRAPLLTRRGRAVELTGEGQLLLDLIQPHVTSLESLERLFASRRSEIPQQLTVASTDYMFACHLKEPIQRYTQANPHVAVKLRVGLWSGDVEHPVARGEADLGMMTYEPDEPRNPALDYLDLFHLPFLLITGRHHELQRKKQISLKDVVRYPLITAPLATNTQRTLVKLLRRHGQLGELRSIMETSSVDLTLSYVVAGIGIALRFVGLDALKDWPHLSSRAITEIPSIPVAVVVRKGAYLPEPARTFVDDVQKYVREK